LAHVRELTLADLPALQALLDASSAYHALAGPADDSLTTWHDQPSGPTKLRFGAFSGEQITAYCEILLGYPTSDVAYLGLLLVHPDHQRRGFGRQLYQHTREVAALPRVRIAVLDNNPDALAFWRRLGFTETGEVKPWRCREIRTLPSP
jgi:ribosomal protein S18 acetylase RimI-like enzyme